MPENDELVMIPCNSTFISAFGWRGGEEPVLRVRFARGEEFEYDLVPESVFEAMKDSERPGQYFRQNIYKSGYGYRRV
jgi:KTSC domain